MASLDNLAGTTVVRCASGTWTMELGASSADACRKLRLLSHHGVSALREKPAARQRLTWRCSRAVHFRLSTALMPADDAHCCVQ